MRTDLHGDWIVASHTAVDRVECPAGASDCVREGLARAYEVLTIHPAHQFWAFQAIETAIFVTLAVGMLIGAIYWTRRRIARSTHPETPVRTPQPPSTRSLHRIGDLPRVAPDRTPHAEKRASTSASETRGGRRRRSDLNAA